MPKKIEYCLQFLGIIHPEAQWMVAFQTAISCLLTLVLTCGGWKVYGAGFALGAFLVSFNLFLLAKFVPHLIWVGKGSVFTLLAGFYLRLVGTILVLFLAIVVAGLSPIGVLAGLSTLLVTFAVWTGRYIMAQQHKEA
jgi:hypothetical protein